MKKASSNPNLVDSVSKGKNTLALKRSSSMHNLGSSTVSVRSLHEHVSQHENIAYLYANVVQANSCIHEYHMNHEAHASQEKDKDNDAQFAICLSTPPEFDAHEDDHHTLLTNAPKLTSMTTRPTQRHPLWKFMRQVFRVWRRRRIDLLQFRA